jgi:hypothetical protein
VGAGGAAVHNLHTGDPGTFLGHRELTQLSFLTQRSALNTVTQQEDFGDVLEADTGLKETTTYAALPPVSGGAASLSFLTATVPPPAPAPISAPSPLAPPSFISGGAPPTGFQFNFSAGGGISPFAANPFGGAPGAIAEPAGQAEEGVSARRIDPHCFFGAHSPTIVDGDDEPQRPPSPSVVRSKGEDDGEETVFDGKAKFLALVRSLNLSTLSSAGIDSSRSRAQINKEWINKGVGNLQLRRPKDAPTGVPGARLLLYNQAGKLALNAKLYAGMKVKQADDKGIALVLVNGAQAAGEEDGAARKPVQTMIRVKDGATAKELIRQIEQHVPLR